MQATETDCFSGVLYDTRKQSVLKVFGIRNYFTFVLDRTIMIVQKSLNNAWTIVDNLIGNLGQSSTIRNEQEKVDTNEL